MIYFIKLSIIFDCIKMKLNYSEQLKFKQQLAEWLQKVLVQDVPSHTVFVSHGSLKNRCKVWTTTDENSQKLIKRTLTYIEKQFAQNIEQTEYLKIDVAKNIEKRTWKDVVHEIESQQHNNHYRKNIAFDEKFGINLLEQEIYGRSVIRGIVFSEPNFVDEKNLIDTLNKKYGQLVKNFQVAKIDHVYVFDTEAVFYENGHFLPLHSTSCENGIRKIDLKSKHGHIKQIIIDNARFLHAQIHESGRFTYGYFPAFDREIKSYNTVRHCTAIYALLETLEVDYKDDYLTKIKTSMQYAIDTFYREVDQQAFMIDGDTPDQEIKLGSNAAAIFMFAKYQEITKDDHYQVYAEKLAEGIRSMVDSQGETSHVLNYPQLDVKEKFRIVYYDGEAALGLLRLYQINQNTVLLDTVKLMFEHFIAKNYDKYHDHWLSYCTNELTKICPEEKYFKFGMNNYLKHMDFIKNRKTAYATFLEMMMSAYKMVIRMQDQGYDELFAQSKFSELCDLIEHRTEFQRTGYFYPEVAMYMAKPDKILNAFNVRHDRLRTRIDDQEHNLSGYVAYVNHFNLNGDSV